MSNKQIDEKVLEKMLHIGEQFFRTADDPSQIPVTKESFYALEMFQGAVSSIPHIEDAALFTWPFSQEGRELTKKLNVSLGRKILLKD